VMCSRRMNSSPTNEFVGDVCVMMCVMLYLMPHKRQWPTNSFVGHCGRGPLEIMSSSAHDFIRGPTQSSLQQHSTVCGEGAGKDQRNDGHKLDEDVQGRT
jgi:hypothetical protein